MVNRESLINLKLYLKQSGALLLHASGKESASAGNLGIAYAALSESLKHLNGQGGTCSCFQGKKPS